MIEKKKEKIKAIRLRKRGKSYNEILEEVPVAKSTLSCWLRGMNLTKRQKQRFDRKRLDNLKKGWEILRRQRVEKTERIIKKAKLDINKISQEDLFILGVMLYWCEGNKQRNSNPSAGIGLGNSDPVIQKLFIKWLRLFFNVKFCDLTFRICIHETANSKRAERFWRKKLEIPKDKRIKLFFKKHRPKTNRKNKNKNYYGLFEIKVRKSTDSNRKIRGWIKGIAEKI